MRQVHLVRPYIDGPQQAFLDYGRAFLRKCELDKEYGEGSAQLESLPFEEDKLRTHDSSVSTTARTNW